VAREKGVKMRREWELEDLIACWTLDEEEFALLGVPVVLAKNPTDMHLSCVDVETGIAR
jgi:hypothetical protein